MIVYVLLVWNWQDYEGGGSQIEGIFDSEEKLFKAFAKKFPDETPRYDYEFEWTPAKHTASHEGYVMEKWSVQ